MKNSNLYISIAALLPIVFLISFAHAQTKPTPRPPEGIKLPDGFRYENRPGIDSRIGAFIRDDGFEIRLDIGRMAGNYAEQYFPEHFERLRKRTHLNPNSIETSIKVLQDKIDWRESKTVDGNEVLIVMLKDATLIASFSESYANFIATADKPDKVKDFLHLVLTYRPPGRNKD